MIAELSACPMRLTGNSRFSLYLDFLPRGLLSRCLGASTLDLGLRPVNTLRWFPTLTQTESVVNSVHWLRPMFEYLNQSFSAVKPYSNFLFCFSFQCVATGVCYFPFQDRYRFLTDPPQLTDSRCVSHWLRPFLD